MIAQNFIDQRPFTRAQGTTCALATGVIMLDYLNLQIFAYAAPMILTDWSMTKVALGAVIASALIGTAIGTFIGGWLGDRVGRRPALIAAVAAFSIGSILCGLAGDVSQLTVFRFASGLGFGACFPNATALVSEWSPLRVRARMVGLTTLGVPLGGVLGALLALSILPLMGWRGCFFAAGGLGVAMLGALAYGMPESVLWLIRNGRQAEMARIAMRVWHEVPETAVEPSGAATTSEERYLDPRFRRSSLGIALAFWAAMFSGLGIANWSPVILAGLGISIAGAIQATMLFNGMTLVTILVGATMANRFGTRSPLLILSLAGCFASVLVGVIIAAMSPHPGQAIALTGMLAFDGACISAAQALLFILAAQAYPVRCRATAIGVSATAGRIGAAMSAIGGGAVLSFGAPALFFVIAGGGMLLVTAGVLITDRHTAARPHADDLLT